MLAFYIMYLGFWLYSRFSFLHCVQPVAKPAKPTPPVQKNSTSPTAPQDEFDDDEDDEEEEDLPEGTTARVLYDFEGAHTKWGSKLMSNVLYCTPPVRKLLKVMWTRYQH